MSVMYFQLIENGISRDIILLTRFLAIIIIFFISFQVGKKIKDTKVFSSTTGFSIFLITLGVFHFLIVIPYLYIEVPHSHFYYTIINTIFLCGMVSFIFFNELDEYLNSSNPYKKKYPFLLTVISTLGASITGILAFFKLIHVVFVFLFVVIPAVIATKIFLKKYKTFEIINRSKSIELFYLGLSLAGFSNFLNNELVISLLGDWMVFLLNTIFIIAGGLLMSLAWSKLPSLSELDWMLKMERLLVVHLSSSRLMYQYNFQVIDEEQPENQIEGSLVSSAIGGVNLLLKEILASNGYIREINHGDKNILFSHGTATGCILITSGHSNEFNYRLKMFHLSFEKQFGEENLAKWSGDLKIFEKTQNLIDNYFS